jgi:hypothetical protein
MRVRVSDPVLLADLKRYLRAAECVVKNTDASVRQACPGRYIPGAMRGDRAWMGVTPNIARVPERMFSGPPTSPNIASRRSQRR